MRASVNSDFSEALNPDSRTLYPESRNRDWVRMHRRIKEQDTGFGVSPSPKIHPSPFLIRGSCLCGSGLADKGFSVPRLMDRGSGARLHRTMVPARGWVELPFSEPPVKPEIRLNPNTHGRKVTLNLLRATRSPSSLNSVSPFR